MLVQPQPVPDRCLVHPIECFLHNSPVSIFLIVVDGNYLSRLSLREMLSRLRVERLPTFGRIYPLQADHELDEEVTGLQLFDEVETVLVRLRKAGLRLAMCSNLAFEYGASVRQLLPDLDVYILSFEVGAAKPDRAIHAATCQALNCEPGNVLFVIDSKRSDLRGPQNYGMQARSLDRRGGVSHLDVFNGII